jgi:hypothetical protein
MDPGCRRRGAAYALDSGVTCEATPSVIPKTACGLLWTRYLLPPDYAGRQAWAHRRRMMAEAGEQIRSLELV